MDCPLPSRGPCVAGDEAALVHGGASEGSRLQHGPDFWKMLIGINT